MADQEEWSRVMKHILYSICSHSSQKSNTLGTSLLKFILSFLKEIYWLYSIVAIISTDYTHYSYKILLVAYNSLIMYEVCLEMIQFFNINIKVTYLGHWCLSPLQSTPFGTLNRRIPTSLFKSMQSFLLKFWLAALLAS